MNWEKITSMTGANIMLASAIYAAVGQRGRAVILLFVAVCLHSCSLGIHVAKCGR